jgi:hypothetical protein
VLFARLTTQFGDRLGTLREAQNEKPVCVCDYVSGTAAGGNGGDSGVGGGSGGSAVQFVATSQVGGSSPAIASAQAGGSVFSLPNTIMPVRAFPSQVGSPLVRLRLC